MHEKIVILKLDLQVRLGILPRIERLELPPQVMIVLMKILERLGVNLLLVSKQHTQS